MTQESPPPELLREDMYRRQDQWSSATQEVKLSQKFSCYTSSIWARDAHPPKHPQKHMPRRT